MSLQARRSQSIPDWFVIERLSVEGAPERLTDAAVEGSWEDMAALAEAVERGGRFIGRRCAVVVHGDQVIMWSPRNSETPTYVPLEDALALARQLRAMGALR